MINNQEEIRIVGVRGLFKRWFIDALSGMALGLFATLIIGTIFEQIGNLIGKNAVGNLIISVAGIAKVLMGAGIGAGIAYILKADKLTIFACTVAGLVGANASGFLMDFTVSVGIGNPIGAYLTSLATVEVCRFVANKTKLDIILVPLTALVITSIVAITLCPPAAWLIRKIAQGIEISMRWNPFVMGIVISAIMGMLLTMPTSSAAIWVSIAIIDPTPEMLLAGGAAAVGGAAHMIGFAVMSFKENGISGLISQGLGTSMLQIPNIMRNPALLIPPVIASIIVGPMSTCLFKLKTGAAGGGMGTSGLVGVINTIQNSGELSPFMLGLGIALLMFILPAIISLGVCYLLRKINWIREGDLKLPL